MEEDELILTVRAAHFFSSSDLCAWWREAAYWVMAGLSLGLLPLVLSWTPLLQARVRFAPATGPHDAGREEGREGHRQAGRQAASAGTQGGLRGVWGVQTGWWCRGWTARGRCCRYTWSRPGTVPRYGRAPAT